MRHNITSIKANDSTTANQPQDLGLIPGTGSIEVRMSDDGESERINVSFRAKQSASRPEILSRDLRVYIKYLDESAGLEQSLTLGTPDIPVRLQVIETDTREISFSYSRKI